MSVIVVNYFFFNCDIENVSQLDKIYFFYNDLDVSDAKTYVLHFAVSSLVSVA